MEDKTKALKELLELLAQHPEIVKRLTITVEPAKLKEDKSRKPK